MIIRNLSEFTRGWFIGDFSPSVLQSKDFEVGILKHPKGQKWAYHYHAVATEYNVLLSGKMIIQGITIEPNTVFVLSPNEISDSEFVEDCTILCVKTPSIPGDKFLV